MLVAEADQILGDPAQLRRTVRVVEVGEPRELADGGPRVAAAPGPSR
jgi:hypothetical protein